MLWTIFIVLIVLWLLGIVSGNLIEGYIHLLLLFALAVIVIRVLQGRKPV